MTTALAIAALEIRRFLRERITLFTTILMPSALMLIIGTAFGGGTAALPVGLIDDDGTPASADFAAELEDSALSVTAYTDPDDIARDIRLGFLAAGVHVPAGFADGLAGDGAEVVMTLDQTSTDGAAVATAINAAAASLGQVPTATRVAITALALDDAGTRAVVVEVAEGVVGALPAIEVSASTVGPEPVTGSAFASAMYTQLTLFIFLNGMLAGIPLVESRRLGVARRMLSTPTGVGPHLLGVPLLVPLGWFAFSLIALSISPPRRRQRPNSRISTSSSRIRRATPSRRAPSPTTRCSFSLNPRSPMRR